MRLRHILDRLSGLSYEWDWYQLWPWQEVIGIDGKPLRGVVMRRKINGQCQYKRPTEEEHSREAERQAFWS